MLDETTCWNMINDYTHKRRSYKFQPQNNWVHGFWQMYYATKKLTAAVTNAADEEGTEAVRAYAEWPATPDYWCEGGDCYFQPSVDLRRYVEALGSAGERAPAPQLPEPQQPIYVIAYRAWRAGWIRTINKHKPTRNERRAARKALTTKEH